jgi:hypothetical protein
MNPFHRYEQVYFVEVPNGDLANPIAIRPKIFENKVQWQDTARGKVLYSAQVVIPKNLTDAPPDLIEIVTREGNRYKLLKLTLDIYNAKLKSTVVKHPSFDSDASVQKFFLNSDFEPS